MGFGSEIRNWTSHSQRTLHSWVLTILARAAAESRVVLTHDVRTMKDFAYDRVRQGLPMPGVFEVSGRHSRYAIIEELQIIAECSEPAEWENRVVFLPL